MAGLLLGVVINESIHRNFDREVIFRFHLYFHPPNNNGRSAQFRKLSDNTIFQHELKIVVHRNEKHQI